MSLQSLFNTIGEDLNKALESTKGVATLYDQVANTIQPVSIVSGEPRAGYPEGQDEINTTNIISRAANTLESGIGFFEQVKGLFGLGYPSDTQPVSPITNDVDPTHRTPDANEIPASGSPDIKILLILGIAAFLFLR